MKEEMYVLPVQCKRCSAVFDLLYDLQELDDDILRFSSSNKIERAFRESFCWDCRASVLEGIEAMQIKDLEEDTDEDEMDDY